MAAVATARQDDKTWAVLSHVSAYLGYLSGIGFWMGPLAFWLAFRSRSRFVAEHAKEALNFHLSLLIYAIVFGVSCFLLVGLLFLPLFVPVFLIVQLVFPILASLEANDGKTYRYPLTLRLIP